MLRREQRVKVEKHSVSKSDTVETTYRVCHL